MRILSPEQRANRKRRLQRRNRLLLIPLGFWSCVLFLLGGSAGALIADPHYKIYDPVELTDAQKNWPGFTAPMQPMDIVVHVLSRKEFIRKGNAAEPGKAAFKDFDAWSRIGGHEVCQVNVPAGYLLQADPHDPSSGNFVDSENADTFAHELLHCNVGE